MCKIHKVKNFRIPKKVAETNMGNTDVIPTSRWSVGSDVIFCMFETLALGRIIRDAQEGEGTRWHESWELVAASVSPLAITPRSPILTRSLGRLSQERNS